MRPPRPTPLLIAFAAVAAAPGCQSAQGVPTVGGDRNPAEAVALDVRTAQDLASRLTGSGLDLTYESRAESNARATGGSVYETGGGELLSIFEYPSATARDADLTFLTGQVGPGGAVYTYGDRLAVAFEGSDADVRAVLDDALTRVTGP